MAYDSTRGRTVLFGGSSGTSIFADTWEWSGATWTQVANSGPTARNRHAMAYDSQRGRTVLFGGFDGSAANGQTWEWTGTLWQPIIFALGPSGRYRHVMAYDSQRGRTVLFGGFNGTVNLVDTWEWSGAAWTQMSNTGPSSASYLAMSYDSANGRSVLCSSGTWEWSGGSWTQVNIAGPVGNTSIAMAYDSLRARTVLVGSRLTKFQTYSETWEYDSHVLYPAQALPFGPGCGSPSLDLSSVASARPIIGTTGQAVLSNVPSSIAFVALGWSRTMIGAFNLPLSLTGWGMPGCDLLQSAEAAADPTTITAPGTAIFSLPIPNLRDLIGLRVYLQAWAAAPGANSAGVIVSNGLEWQVGDA